MTHETIYAKYAEISVGTGETMAFDKQKDIERWYSMYTEIREELEVMVARIAPDQIRICQDDGDEHAHIVVLEREEARRVVEVIQGWLGGEK